MTSATPELTAAAARGGDSTVITSGPQPRAGSRFLRAFLSDVPAMLSSAYIVLMIVAAVFAPLIVRLSGWGPYEFDQDSIDPNLGALPIGPLGGMGAEHWFGVEPGNGRDIFARIVYGARVSLTLALSATALTTLLGTVFGLLAGYFGGRGDAVISRAMECLMAFPALIFMIAILSARPADNRVVLLVLVISLFGWPYLARIVRSQTLSLKEREFVESARASGAT